ncbi:MAG TPA: ATP-dependent DNA ligase [Abditibacteriaceae bacterium]|jgi:DNA ligase-1
MWNLFCQVALRVEGTRKRLEKAAIIGEFLAPLSDADLVLAARFFAGTPFPQRDGRTVNIGGAALLNAIQSVTGVEETALRELVVILGDWGDVVGEVWPQSEQTQSNTDSDTSLADVSEFFEQLAATAGSGKKRMLTAKFLAPLSAVEARFVVKLLTGDLRIGLKESAVEDALARMTQTKLGAVQWANMMTGDIGETALLARRDELDSAPLRLFHPLKFMLATPAADLADVARQMPERFAVEDKFDGIRAHAHISHSPELVANGALHGVAVASSRIALFSRTLDDITASFPDLVDALGKLTGDWILDGEIVPVNGEEILPFQVLQKRLGRKTPPAGILKEIPVAFIIYDVLYIDNRVLLNEAFVTRRSCLEVLPQSHSLRVADSKIFEEVAPLDDEFDAARARGNEGLMVKSLESNYKPGKRGRDWLKIKRALATLDVVVTSVEVGNGRRSKFLSDFTFAVRASETDETLLNIGKAYSGLTDAEIAELTVWFQEHTTQTFAHGKVRIVEPRIVIEVTFDRVQPSPRHKSGYALRFPRIVRLRPDKPVEEIDTLETVRLLAH